MIVPSSPRARSIVASCIDSLLRLGLFRQGALSTLCYRFKATPKLPPLSLDDLPKIDVERRSLAVYDEAAS